MPLPTPSTSHLSDDDPVYPPSEDSYLLLDALSLPSETTLLTQRFPLTSPTPLLVELGTGSGIVSAFLLANAEVIFGRNDVAHIGIDVSRLANIATNTTIATALAEGNGKGGVTGGSITSDLASALRPNCVDVLVFNPPYVPSEELPSLQPLQETKRDEEYLLSLTYAGGKEGMETTDRVLDGLGDILNERGVFYLLLCKSNKPEGVAEGIRKKGWTVELVMERKAGWEKLSIWRIWKP